MFDYRPLSRRRRSSFHIFDLITVSLLTRYAFFAAVGLVLLIPLLFLWYGRDLPTPGKIVVSKYTDATRIYDRKGVLLYSVYQDQNRTYVPLSQIPKELREATISIEDKDFYKNKGFSILGYLRAVRDAFFLRGLTGASTITQQLVKNVLLTNERSLERKIKEFILAIQVDNKFSKDQILEMYLNNVPYGSTAIGAEAASQMYFGKKVAELDIAESAFLAGLPQSPSRYSPFTGERLYVGRTKAVLKQMRENDYITKDEEAAALKKITFYTFSRKESQIKAPHFVFFVKKQLEEKFGEHYVTTGGLQVTTTLDYELQKRAEDIVKEEVDKLEKYNAKNGAALITDPKTGEILAMVGSKDYYDEKNQGNFNVVTSETGRQPGSSLKPLIYAAAFEKGYTPATLLWDVKTEFPTDDPTAPIYTPVDYSGKFSGPVQVRFALGNSINIPAVKMLSLIGIKDAMQKAYMMGITNWEPTPEHMKSVGLSLVLGGRETNLLDEVRAYGVFANKGVRQDQVAILNVKDPKGKILFEQKKREGQRVLSEEVAFLISHILLDNTARIQEFGPNSYLRIPGKTVSVKTGTTDQKRDNWTVGYTPSYVVGVWVGNNDNTPMNPAITSGVTGASPIWHRLMTLVLKDMPNEEFETPSNVTSVQIDSLFGGTPFGGSPTRSEFFIKGTEPTANSPIYQRDFYVVKEDDPVSKDGRNRWQEAVQTWIDTVKKDDAKWHPPDDIKNPKPTENPSPTASGDSGSLTPTETPTPTLTVTPTP